MILIQASFRDLRHATCICLLSSARIVNLVGKNPRHGLKCWLLLRITKKIPILNSKGLEDPRSTEA